MPSPRKNTLSRVAPRHGLAAGIELSSALALVASLCWISSGCGAKSDGATNNNNGSCTYYLSVFPLSPNVGDLVTMEVSYTGYCSPSTYQWSATGPDGLAADVQVRSPPRSAEMVPLGPGHYMVSVEIFDAFADSVRVVDGGFVAVDPTGNQRSYLLRFTPPASAQVPRQQEIITVTGNTPMGGLTFALEQGALLENTLTGPGGAFGAYVRLIQSGFPLYREVHVDGTGALSLRLLASASYDVVVIPDDDSLAPALLSDMTLLDLQDPAAFLFEEGTWVTGYVLDASDLPVTGAQVGLRSGVLPSDIGVAAAFDGRFTLLARPGEQSLEIAPGQGAGLPGVRIPAGPELAVVEQSSLELTFVYADLPRTVLDLQVVLGGDGAPLPLEGARVTLEATGLVDVGTLTVTRDGSTVATLQADGGFRITLTSGPDGHTGPTLVPPGIYRVIIEPTAELPQGYAATLISSFVVSGASLSTQVGLAEPWRLEGQVVDMEGTPQEGVAVKAVTDLGLGSGVEGVTDQDGRFSLEVVAGASYTLLVLPDPSAGLGRLRLADIPIDQPVTEATTAMGTALVLPPALVLQGIVTLQSTPVEGVLVQAIPAGVAGEPVLGEAVTGPGGELTLTLPDPGVAQ